MALGGIAFVAQERATAPLIDCAERIKHGALSAQILAKIREIAREITIYA